MNEQELNDFIESLWQRENMEGFLKKEKRGGYKNGRYFKYKAANGYDVGPGFDLNYASPEFVKKASTVGFTKEELDNEVKKYIKNELQFIDKRLNKESMGKANQYSPDIKKGLLMMYWQLKNGLYQNYPNLWNSLGRGDMKGVRKESLTHYQDKHDINKNKNTEEMLPDTSRQKYINENYFYGKTPFIESKQNISKPLNTSKLNPIQDNFWTQWSQIPYKQHGGKISEEIFLDIMKQVGRQNYKNWGFRTPEEATNYALKDKSYDYRSFYSENPEAINNSKTHWPDTYKGVTHRTFSNESRYHGKVDKKFNPKGLRGGLWTGDKFISQPWQIPSLVINAENK